MAIIVPRHTNVWRSFPVQLLGAVAVTGGPFLLRLPFPGVGANEFYNLTITTVASFVAVLLVILIERGIVRYPGVEIGASVLTFVSIGFGLVLTVLVLGRIEYNRFTLIASYALSISWFWSTNYLAQHERRMRIGVVPSPGTAAAGLLPGVTTRPLISPDDPVDDLDAVTLDLRVDIDDRWDRRIADLALAGVPVYHIKHLRESLSGRVELEHLSETSYGTLSPPLVYMAFRRILDRAVALVALVALLPLVPFVYLAIRLDGPGPMLFRQRRVGYRGQSFTVFKLRTMVHHAAATPEEVDGRVSAMTQSNDARITRVGRILRKTRLDELPQIINVVRGEMSWIGPRPEAEVLSAWYEREIPFYRYRHIVYPGITGWAQVSQGHVAEVTDVKDKLYYDFFYIKHLSLWIDLLIVVRTIRTMVTGSGAK